MADSFFICYTIFNFTLFHDKESPVWTNNIGSDYLLVCCCSRQYSRAHRARRGTKAAEISRHVVALGLAGLKMVDKYGRLHQQNLSPHLLLCLDLDGAE